MTDQNNLQPLHSDEPITSSDDDRLNRARLVEVIAAQISAIPPQQSTVLAINAPWGAGKSSFINLLEAKLLTQQHAGKSKQTTSDTILIRFNPWHYTSLDQLVQMFFAEFASKIKKFARAKIRRKIGKLFSALASLTSVFHAGGGKAVKHFADLLSNQTTLQTKKAQLDGLLLQLQQRIVVFIDDIDRLERDALRLLFRLIRLTANFPNVTYVLAFDRGVVECNLNEDSGICGRDYLEKIIQASFDIPEPEPSALYTILGEELASLIATTPESEQQNFDKHRWQNQFLSGFNKHFRTIRHIKRYSNSLRMTLPLVVGEVDLPDFMAIELLRVFHPEVYRKIAQSKSLLAPLPQVRTLPQNHLKQWLADISTQASSGLKEQVAELLKHLFPQLKRAHQNISYGAGHPKAWRRDRRVCSHDHFDKYFLLGVPSLEISEAEITTLISQLHSTGTALTGLKSLIEAGKAKSLIFRLPDHLGQLAPPQLSILVQTLFEFGDDLRFESTGLFDLFGERQVGFLIRRALAQVESDDERLDLLLDGINRGSSLHTIVEITFDAQPKDNDGRTELVADPNRWTELKLAALSRIHESQQSGSLWTCYNLPFVLYRWRDWAGEEAVKNAVAVAVESSAKNLCDFCEAFIQTTHTHKLGDKVSESKKRLSKKDLSKFIAIEDLNARLKQAASQDQDPRAESLLKLLRTPSRLDTI